MRNLTLSRKLLVVLLSSIAFTILFSFFFIHFLYSKLYLDSMEESIVYQGKRTASHYHYGELSDEIIEKIQWYNIVSEYEIIVVDHLDELTTYFPYKLDYKNLVDKNDYATLEKGAYVVKKGYVEELGREVLGAIFPIKGNDGLIGFIYIYVPLADIQDVFRESIPILIAVGTLFFFILFLVVNRAWQSIFKPLQDLQHLSGEISKGNYSKRMHSNRHDEIGQLAEAFNSMSHSLEKQEEQKKEFTSNIVHELRTPLTYISGYVHALQEKIYSSPEEAESYLSTIEKETKRINKLINDLAELNHLQDGMYKMERQPIAIAQLLLDTLELFQFRLNEKNAEMQLELEEDIIVEGDPQRIQQVFYNTIDNAIKYADPNSVLRLQLIEKDGQVSYRLTNSGITIPEEDLARIGERFFRTDKARNRTTGGTGLGLSIVKEIVRMHGGTFTIESDETNGTTVTIGLPSLSTGRRDEYDE